MSTVLKLTGWDSVAQFREEVVYRCKANFKTVAKNSIIELFFSYVRDSFEASTSYVINAKISDNDDDDYYFF